MMLRTPLFKMPFRVGLALATFFSLISFATAADPRVSAFENRAGFPLRWLGDLQLEALFTERRPPHGHARTASSFQDHFATLTDPRCPHAPNQRHQLIDILVIAVCAVICGADGWEDIEEYGKAPAEWFAELLDLPHGIPGHDDTFRRVLSRLDPEELTQCFIAWTGALSDLSGGDIVSIDGKTLRHSFDRRPRKPPSTW